MSVTFRNPMVFSSFFIYSASAVSVTSEHHGRSSVLRFKPLFNWIGLKLLRCLIIKYSSGSSTTIASEIGTYSSLLREIGLSDREIKVLVRTNPAIRSSSYESLSKRIVSLQLLGISGTRLCRLLMRQRTLLTADEIAPFLHFLLHTLNGEMRVSQLHHLLSTTDPKLLLGFDAKVSLLLLYGIPQEKLPYILNNITLSKAISLKPFSELEKTLSLLEVLGVVGIIVRRPAILNYNLETQILPRIHALTELCSGDRNAAGLLLRKLPALLTYTVAHMESHVEFLRSFVGLTGDEIFQVINIFPNVFSTSKTRKLYPRISFLKDCGLSPNDIFKLLIKSPLLLGVSFKSNLGCKLSVLVKIGYGCKSKEIAIAVGAVTRTSCQNLQQVVDLFLRYGLSSEDIYCMSKRHPQVLQYRCASLEEKMEYLTHVMGRDVEELLAFPAFLGYKLDGRIKQRYEGIRKSIGRGGNVSINNLLTKPVRITGSTSPL